MILNDSSDDHRRTSISKVVQLELCGVYSHRGSLHRTVDRTSRYEGQAPHGTKLRLVVARCKPGRHSRLHDSQTLIQILTCVGTGQQSEIGALSFSSREC